MVTLRFLWLGALALLLLLVTQPCRSCLKCSPTIATSLRALQRRMEADRPFIRTTTFKGVQGIIAKLLGEKSQHFILHYDDVERTMGAKYLEMNSRIGDVSGQLSEKHYAAYRKELAKLWKAFGDVLRNVKEPSCPLCQPTYRPLLHCETCEKVEQEVCMSFCERNSLEKEQRAPLAVLDYVDPYVIPEPDYDPEIEPINTRDISLIAGIPAALSLIIFAIVLFCDRRKDTAVPARSHTH